MIDPLDGGFEGTPHLPVQSHSKQRIHNAVTGKDPGAHLDILRIKVLQRSAAGLQTHLHDFAVMGHVFPSAHQKGAHDIPLLHQQSCHRNAVAAVVARTAKHRNSGHIFLIFRLHQLAQLLLPVQFLFRQLCAVFSDPHHTDSSATDPPPVLLQQAMQVLRGLRGRMLHQFQRGNSPLFNGNAVQFSHLSSSS